MILVVIDHIDRDTTNNSISNLRVGTLSANGKNKIHPLSNTGHQSIHDGKPYNRLVVRYKRDLKIVKRTFNYTKKSTT